MTDTPQPVRRGLAGRIPSVRFDGAPWRRRVTGARRRALGLGANAWFRAVDLTERPREALAPVTSVVRPAAWVVGATAAVALVAGFRLGWDELVAGGFFLLALLLLCVPFVLGGHHVSAQLDLTRDRVVVGERATGRMVVTNTGHHRSLPLTIELPVGRTGTAFEMPSLKADASHEELFVIPTSRRAILDLGPVRAVRSDPLALLRRDQELTERALLHVHPRTVRIDGTAAGFVRDLEGLTVRKLSDNDVAFHALREYVPGDDRRFIHWKSSARTGTLMVRQFEETRRAHLLVALSTRLDDYADDDELELAVSVAGSLAAQSLRDGHTTSTLTSTAALRSEHPVLLLDQLSGVGYEPMAPRTAETVRRLAREAAGASVAVFVCGSVAESAELRRARRYLAPEVRTIVLRVHPGADVALRTMGDIDMATIGSLDDLAGAIRRLAAG